MPYSRHIIISLYLLFGFALHLCAQWNPFVVNFKKEEFGRGVQTWMIAPFAKGAYCANKNGLLQYNGYDWHLFTLENGRDVRSVLLSEKKNRVYVGGDGEFGYFTHTDDKLFSYENISKLFVRDFGTPGSIWQIFEIDEITFYVSSWSVIKQTRETFTLIPSEHKIDCSEVVNGILYIGTADGVKMLVGNGFISLSNADEIIGETIRGIRAYGSGILIGTALAGLYTYSDNQLQQFETSVDAFIRTNELFSLDVKGNRIAAGTIQAGVVLLDPESGLATYYNESNGLQNNTVLSLAFDDYDGLWLGLDNGIDYIRIHSQYTNLYKTPHSQGSGYVIQPDHDRMYFGTNRGLFYTPWPVIFREGIAEIESVPQTSGQVWDIKRNGNDLFCLHDKGLFIVNRNGAYLIPELRGSVMCYNFPDRPDRCWVGSYEGLYLLEKQRGQWQIAKRIDNINGWLKRSVFEAENIYWDYFEGGGLGRIVIDLEQGRASDPQYYNPPGMENTDWSLSLVDGRLCFTSEAGFYTYDRIADKIIPDDAMNNAFPPGICLSMDSSDSLICALYPDNVLVYRKNEKKTTAYPFIQSQIEFIRSFENIQIVNDSTIIIPNEYGFAYLDLVEEAYVVPANELFLKRVYVSYPKDSLIYMDGILENKQQIKLPYHDNSIRFEYACRTMGDARPTLYRYRLNTDREWSEPTPVDTKEYSNLREGSYSFEVHTLDNPEDIVSYSFSISPPWYRSMYAILIYLILFILGLYCVVRWDDKRIRNKKAQALVTKEKEIKI